MHFSIELSLIIDEELRKKGIDRKIRSFDPGFCVFTYDELDKITSLELSRVSSLEGLELLPNLRKLIIKSPDFSNVSSDVDINDSNMNSIKDFSLISRLTKLEELQIINDINLSSLDITKLEELRNLEEAFFNGTKGSLYVDVKEYEMYHRYLKNYIYKD